MFQLASCIAAVALALAQGAAGAAPPEAPASASFTYRFENPRFQISRIELDVDASGAGRLVFTKQGLAKPVSRDVRVAEPVLRQLDELLGRLDFLRSDATYQTKDDHSNLGTTTVGVSRSGERREATFNYTENRDMAVVAATLRGVANREIFVFELETAMRFQPLDTPALINALDQDIKLGRITDPAALAPLLREVANDPSLPLIARNRAAELAGRVEESGRP
jgi:hypothetical protein